MINIQDFLFTKYQQYSQRAVDAFYADITNNLSTVGKTSSGNPEIAIWGREDGGFWNVSSIEAQYFENNGTFHIVGIERDQNYYNIFNDIYQASLADVNSPCQFAKPVSHTQLTVDSVDGAHPGGLKNGDTVSYMTFQSPVEGYGNHYYQDFLVERNTDWDSFFLSVYGPILTWLFKTLKQLNHPAPKDLPERFLMQSGNTYFFTKLEPLTRPLNDMVQDLIDSSAKHSTPVASDYVKANNWTSFLS